MMKYDQLIRLLPYLAAFEEEGPKPDWTAKDFAYWILEQDIEVDNITELAPAMPLQGDLAAQITQLVTLNYKYLRFYLKKKFKDEPISTIDEFGFLAALLVNGTMQKKQLIDKNTMEFSSGMEIIRRLKRGQFISSQPDPSDGRAKLVSLSPKGEHLIMQLLPQMGQLGKLAIAPLSKKEQQQLHYLLQKLNVYHNPIFYQAHQEDMQTILAEKLGE
ncbi:transcriptional regulator [Saprospira grandis DSM 2844]|uniref:Transcriptional regulator n=1 Tax=Saprospira grandis DSM 2844 TaxID=694433 RepID=J1I4Y8_9BACT|nr:winged helix DNA-binding protein [Saprospira grandis]EJF53810.1 transcriptional regulator [Saprospira grandis DSM 2844]